MLTAIVAVCAVAAAGLAVLGYREIAARNAVGGALVQWWNCPRCRFLWHTVNPTRPVCPACGTAIEEDE